PWTLTHIRQRLHVEHIQIGAHARILPRTFLTLRTAPDRPAPWDVPAGRLPGQAATSRGPAGPLEVTAWTATARVRASRNAGTVTHQRPIPGRHLEGSHGSEW